MGSKGGTSATKIAPRNRFSGANSRPATRECQMVECRALNQLTLFLPGSVMRNRSACPCALIKQEADLHGHPKLGHSVVLHHGLEFLGPDRLDVADRAGRALDRFSDR